VGVVNGQLWGMLQRQVSSRPTPLRLVPDSSCLNLFEVFEPLKLASLFCAEFTVRTTVAADINLLDENINVFFTT
jgi:hypothetical protein